MNDKAHNSGLVGPLHRQAQWLEDYSPQLRLIERGTLVSIGDGIARLTGLPSAAISDIVAFEDGSEAMVFDLSPDRVGAVLLKQFDTLTAGMAARVVNGGFRVPVGDELLGRVVDPLGVPLIAETPLSADETRSAENSAPPITERDFIHEPIYSGIKVVDTMIPIGKGQRQLIVGDEGTGRSSLAIDMTINQRGKGVNCVYVLIGQKRSTVMNTIELFQKHDAMEYTTVVVAEATALPGLQHMAPYTGCAIAEHWMRQGKDTLIVYDDLSSHAKNYRELSLLLRRPPGREAYPGDIFSIHAQLLERSTCLATGIGGGSMTALAIVETQQGEIAAYIPTNLISITDGQLYLDAELFASGFRPAIHVGESVSRIGGRTQHSFVKQEAGRMKLDYLQFTELEIFTRFGARLEASMEKAISRGRVLRELLKQERRAPVSVEFNVGWMIAFNDGMLDDKQDVLKESLDRIRTAIDDAGLALDTKRERWSSVLESALKEVPREVPQ